MLVLEGQFVHAWTGIRTSGSAVGIIQQIGTTFPKYLLEPDKPIEIGDLKTPAQTQF